LVGKRRRERERGTEKVREGIGYPNQEGGLAEEMSWEAAPKGSEE
jgi:hypothetical protein